METGHDAEAGQVTTERFAVVMRGYERTAVEEALREEQARHRALADRADVLQRELDALGTAGGVPSRKRVLRRALDLIADGWDAAVAMTAETEYAMGRARAYAEGVAATRLEITEKQCTADERAAKAESDRLIGVAHEEAIALLAEVNAHLERAALAAVELIKLATERAEDVTREFDEAFRTLAAEADTELRERQTKAEFDLETAQAQTASARADAEAIMQRAQAQREVIMEHARKRVLEIEAAADNELLRMQEDTDRAVAELADLMLSAGGKLTGSGHNGRVVVSSETPRPESDSDKAAPAA